MINNIYDKNGLVFWEETDIRRRSLIQNEVINNIKESLSRQNKAFRFFMTEAPMLTPSNLIDEKYYANEDVFSIDDLTLRPETTKGSYEFARYITTHRNEKLPICVYQSGKSFRREQDQPTKFMRVKELSN